MKAKPNSPLGDLKLQNVSIPAPLLQATGNIGSLRDRGESLTWEPQSSLPFLDRRSSGRGSSPYRKRSYTPGIDDTLTTIPRGNKPTAPESSTPASSIWSTADPFSTSNDSVNDVSAQTARRTSPPLGPQAPGLKTLDKTCERQVRRGTLQSFVDAIVPDAVQRRYTNTSFARKGSIWQVYEKAKQRSVQLQRSKIAQITFEYSIYAVLILLVYFVLIGVPLWRGAVYWLWWVVAHKFVIAGGFSITLGIALL
jgi:hypothetical protein